MLQMDLNETMIHDPVLGVNIFMPIITGTKLVLAACGTIKPVLTVHFTFRKR